MEIYEILRVEILDRLGDELCVVLLVATAGQHTDWNSTCFGHFEDEFVARDDALEAEFEQLDIIIQLYLRTQVHSSERISVETVGSGIEENEVETGRGKSLAFCQTLFQLFAKSSGIFTSTSGVLD